LTPFFVFWPKQVAPHPILPLRFTGEIESATDSDNNKFIEFCSWFPAAGFPERAQAFS
jgi:hypothetical protein